MPSYFLELSLEDDDEDVDRVFDRIEGLLWSVLPESQLLLLRYA